jgi:hypothetical protein
MRTVFGFRNATEQLRLAGTVSPTTGPPDSVGVHDGWDDKSVQEKD